MDSLLLSAARKFDLAIIAEIVRISSRRKLICGHQLFVVDLTAGKYHLSINECKGRHHWMANTFATDYSGETVGYGHFKASPA